MIIAEILKRSRPDWAYDTSFDIATLKLTYPRMIHSELMTHRVFSRGASSSRAIPTATLIKSVKETPALPCFWGKNQPGMQAPDLEHIAGVDNGLQKVLPVDAWKSAAKDAATWAQRFADAGYHKQITNRLLEPFMHISVIVTSTEWENFFNLRCHSAAQPEIKILAEQMRLALETANVQILKPGEMHIPFVNSTHGGAENLARSVACCARVSYNNHDNTAPDPIKDNMLYNNLLNSRHMSPFEHQATAVRKKHAINGSLSKAAPIGMTHKDKYGHLWSNNFRGWVQYRATLNAD